MSAKTLIVICALLFIGSAVQADVKIVHWGGPGYDPANRGKKSSSLYSAHPDLYNPDGRTRFQIRVDSEKTVKGVGKMVIRQAGKNEIVSGNCFKVQRHINAPTACWFKKSDFLESLNDGYFLIYDRDGQAVLQSTIDLTLIKQVF